jgi:hypothetical protein
VTTRLPTASRNAACDAVVDLLDAGSGAATIEIRSGTQPASANDAGAGTASLPALTSAGTGSAKTTGVGSIILPALIVQPETADVDIVSVGPPTRAWSAGPPERRWSAQIAGR